jgi:hypothetical protein
MLPVFHGLSNFTPNVVDYYYATKKLAPVSP